MHSHKIIFPMALFVTLLWTSSYGFGQSVSFTHGTYSHLLKPSAEDIHADLNGDGREDFITQDCGGFAVSLSSGPGSYDAPACYTPPTGLIFSFAVGDFNNDGKLDVIANNVDPSCADCLHEFLNNGDGTLRLQPTIRAGVPVKYVATGDANHDGRIDVMFITSDSQGNSSLHVLFGNGHGGFTTGPISPVPLMFAILPIVGDFDGDGKADVLVEGPSQVNSQVLYGDGAGHFQAGPAINDNIHHDPYDLNGDGKMDLLGSHDSVVSVYYGLSNRTFTHHDITLAHCASGLPVVADFNGDGSNDIAISEQAMCGPGFSTNTLVVLLGKPDGTFQPEQTVYTSEDHFLEPWEPMRIDRGRKPDIAVQTLTTGREVDTQLLFTNTSASFNVPRCDPPNRALGFNLCSPTSSVSASPSVRFSVGAANQTPGRKVEVWIDGKKLAENLRGFSHYSFLDATLTLAPGTHQVAIFTAGWDDILQEYPGTTGFASTFPLTVGSNACPVGGGLTVCSPLNNSTLVSPVRTLASGSLNGKKILRMEVWVDGVKKFTTFNSNTLDTNLQVDPGVHQFAYFLVATDGSKTLSTVEATVR